MKITLLGTGDAIGTPKIGCFCENCMTAYREGLSRLRTSLMLELDGKHILIDSSPDLRQQLLRAGSPHVDAVIWTHGHYDHFLGYGEFYRVQGMPPAYAAPPVMDYCAAFLHFLSFEENRTPVFSPFTLAGTTFTLFPVNHPPTYTCGVMIERDGKKVVYTSDTREDIPGESRDLIMDPDLLFVDAIAPVGFSIKKHMNYAEACLFARSIRAQEFRCVHMSHMMPWNLPFAGVDMETFLV